MTKESFTTNSQSENYAKTSEELIANPLPPRIGPYRSLSAKRPRDPSHRKSVSFNDVPIVHEVPLHDMMRNSNCDTYRSWAYTDATSPSSGIASFYSSQVLLPFNSTSAAAQKIHANRLSSTLYSTPSTTSSSPSILTSTSAAITTTTTTTTTPSTTAATSTNHNNNTMTTTTTTTAHIPTTTRMPEWAIRPRTTKATSTSEETSTSTSTTTTTNEAISAANPPVIIVHIPDDRTVKDVQLKPNNQSTNNTIYIPHTVTQSSSTYSSLHNVDNGEEKKYPYRSAMVPDSDHYRSIPFAYTPLTDSTATYTSMLSTNLIQSNHSSTEHSTTGYSRAARARSATLPVTTNHSPTRGNDSISITPFRATTTNFLPNGSNSSARTVLRPTTIAFQCSQPTAAMVSTNNGSSTINTIPTNSNGNNTNQSSSSSSSAAAAAAATATATANTTKPPPTPSRFGSSAAAAAVHSRFVLPANRTLSASSLNSSAIKYTFAHPNMDSTFPNTLTSHNTTPKPPPTTYARSRSAHVLSTRRTVGSPVVMVDSHSNGVATTNHNSNLYATTKRNPNVRQTYGSYYMHRVLLPTSIH